MPKRPRIRFIYLPIGSNPVFAAGRVPPPPDTMAVRGNRKKGIQPETARDVYEGGDIGGKGSGRYFVTYSVVEVQRSAIDEALRRGLIRSKWDIDGYWCLADA